MGASHTCCNNPSQIHAVRYGTILNVARLYGVGSNQYRVRRRATGGLVDPDQSLLHHAQGSDPVRVRCGEIWGSACPAWVSAPNWTHGKHVRFSRTRWAPAGSARFPRPEAVPPPALLALSSSPYVEVRVAVARHSGCPNELIDLLTQDLSEEVREAAWSRSTQLDRLMQALQQRDPAAAGGIVNNPASSTEMLRQVLGHDPSNLILGRMLAHPACPPDLLHKFWSDESLTIRRGLASNPQCPPDILLRLATDSDSGVRRKVAHHRRCTPAVFAALLAGDDRWARDAAARNPRLPPQLMIQLASADEEILVHAALAENPACHPDALDLLANLEHTMTQIRVAQHPNCAPRTLARLLSSEDTAVRNIAWGHPNLPDEYRALFHIAR